MGLITTVSRRVDSKRVRSCFAIVKAEIPSEMRQKAIDGFLKLLFYWKDVYFYSFTTSNVVECWLRFVKRHLQFASQMTKYRQQTCQVSSQQLCVMK